MSNDKIIVGLDMTGIHGIFVRIEPDVDKPGFFFPIYIPAVCEKKGLFSLLRRNREERYPHSITEAQFIESKILPIMFPGAVEQVIHILPLDDNPLNRLNDISTKINNNYIKLTKALAESRHATNLANNYLKDEQQENASLNKKVSGSLGDSERHREMLERDLMRSVGSGYPVDTIDD